MKKIIGLPEDHWKCTYWAYKFENMTDDHGNTDEHESIVMHPMPSVLALHVELSFTVVPSKLQEACDDLNKLISYLETHNENS